MSLTQGMYIGIDFGILSTWDHGSKQDFSLAEVAVNGWREN